MHARAKHFPITCSSQNIAIYFNISKYIVVRRDEDVVEAGKGARQSGRNGKVKDQSIRQTENFINYLLAHLNDKYRHFSSFERKR